MEKMVWFDMDGTIANLYAVEGWLDDLQAERTRPYDVAVPMLNFSQLAKLLHRVQQAGWKIGIISWTSKCGSELYNLAVEAAKREWLAKHLPSVEWDEIKVVRYGTNKYITTGGGILFDDEAQNRNTWFDESFDPTEIINILRKLGE